jgi:hypothetical protein
VLNGRRSSLAPNTFKRLIFLHDNGPLGIATTKDDNCYARLYSGALANAKRTRGRKFESIV